MFPYLDVKQKEVTDFADTVYKVAQAERIVTHKKSKRTVEAITVTMRFLEQNEGFVFRHAGFCECMGFAAEACVYASAFGFKTLESIELCEASTKLGYCYLRMMGEKEAASFSSAVSRFQERMGIHCEVNYFDTIHLGDLDEGILIQAYLDSCKRILPGSYAILVTKHPGFKLSSYNIDYLKIILPTTVAATHDDEGYVYMMKRLSMPGLDRAAELSSPEMAAKNEMRRSRK